MSVRCDVAVADKNNSLVKLVNGLESDKPRMGCLQRGQNITTTTSSLTNSNTSEVGACKKNLSYEELYNGEHEEFELNFSSDGAGNLLRGKK